MKIFFHYCPENRDERIKFSFFKKKFCGLFLVLFLVLTASPLISAFKPVYPNYNFSFGTKAFAMGNAFTAVADDLSTVFWNPAGIADFLHPLVFLNYRINSTSYEFEIQEYNFADYSQKCEENFFSKLKSIDFLAISVPALFWNVKWNFALSYYHYIPYNLQGYHKTQLTTAGDSTYTEKTTTEFSGSSGIDILGFSLAVYLSEYFSIGFTLQHFFNSGTMEYDFVSTDLKYKKSYVEKLQGQNLIFGCLLKLEKNLQIGFAYHSGIEDVFTSESRYENLTDNKIIQESSRSEIVIPAQFSFG
ncbi:MAG: hypothetical protein KAT17_02475, partial [Candidatus Aminicenantes bacterium]|nr:hypothetical protein [Candidatus Aminicenantes bacterium]